MDQNFTDDALLFASRMRSTLDVVTEVIRLAEQKPEANLTTALLWVVSYNAGVAVTTRLMKTQDALLARAINDVIPLASIHAGNEPWAYKRSFVLSLLGQAVHMHENDPLYSSAFPSETMAALKLHTGLGEAIDYPESENVVRAILSLNAREREALSDAFVIFEANDAPNMVEILAALSASDSEARKLVPNEAYIARQAIDRIEASVAGASLGRVLIAMESLAAALKDMTPKASHSLLLGSMTLVNMLDARRNEPVPVEPAPKKAAVSKPAISSP